MNVLIGIILISIPIALFTAANFPREGKDDFTTRFLIDYIMFLMLFSGAILILEGLGR